MSAKKVKKTAKPNKIPFTRETLEKIYKNDRTIFSLVRNNMYHYNMLLALQEQITCIEAKIKILEAKIERLAI